MSGDDVPRGLQTVALCGGAVEVTRLGVGGGPLGNLFAAVSDDDVDGLLRRAFDVGVRYFDTAPVYGMGLAETRLGRALGDTDRDCVVVSTKVGRLLRADAPPDPELLVGGEPFFRDAPALNPVWDFSVEGTRRSLVESLERLSLDAVDIAFLHEPPDGLIAAAATDGYAALRDLRTAGAVRAIGIGWDRVRPMTDLVRELDLDCIMVAGRYSLLDHSALDALLPACVERSTAVLVGGVFNSGILATEDVAGPYDYLPAPEPVREAVRRARKICDAFDVPLRAVALQFPLAHPAVAGVVMGMRSVAELDDNLAQLDRPVPDAVWSELKAAGIIAPEAPTPDGV